ncbi:MAG: histidine kinase [Rhodocyclaceae bacterium]|nr:histidine kinase [Rhodocyclaceae bacterium]
MSIPSASPLADRLDLANPGVWLKFLLAGNGLMFLAVALCAPTPSAFLALLTAQAAWVEPVLLATLLGLVGVRRLAPRCRWPLFLLVAAFIAAALTAGILVGFLPQPDEFAGRKAVAAALATLAIVHGLELARRARRPALAEARFAALTTRMRPHFLFNSLNTALALLRSDPQRAETVLEALADLFRAALAAPDQWSPLSAELDLARRYLDIERLRLGARLHVDWQVEACPVDVLVPPYLLQPLIENAVYHGIEPLASGGRLRIALTQTRDEIRIEIENPLPAHAPERQGNRVALENLRERLALFYDLAARLETERDSGLFRVRLVLPVRR